MAPIRKPAAAMSKPSGPASDPAIVALLIAVFASLRAESRGAHARTDFPAEAGRCRTAENDAD